MGKEGNWCCRFGVFVVVLPWNLLQIASAGRFLGICRPFRSNHLRNLSLPLADASMIYWSSLVDGGGIVIVASVFCVCFCRIEILLRPMNLLVVWLSFDLLTPNLSLPQAEDALLTGNRMTKGNNTTINRMQKEESGQVSLSRRIAPSPPLDFVSTRPIPISWDVPRTCFVWRIVVCLSEATVSLLTFVMSPSTIVICRRVSSALVKIRALLRPADFHNN